MREVHLAGLDLNLLPALEALLKRRNVTEAARDVGLSQPAMSRALARLREVLGDPLLVRTGSGYALSPRGQQLSAQLITALDHVKAVFRDPGFDPAKTERVIRIAGIDTHTLLLAPPLMARLAREAPGIDIRIVGYSPNIIAQMETGPAICAAMRRSISPLPHLRRPCRPARGPKRMRATGSRWCCARGTRWRSGPGRRKTMRV